MKYFWLVTLLLIAPIKAGLCQTSGWEFPTTSTYTASSTDNGKILSSDNVPGASITVTLPNPATVGAGWIMGFRNAGGHGIITNSPVSIYILSGQKTLTSYSSPSNTNYEYFVLQSDGTNFQLISTTDATALFNGVSTAAGSWIYLYTTGYASSLADNGFNFSSAFAGGPVVITLPSTGNLPNGWGIGLWSDGGNSITLQKNTISGGNLVNAQGQSVSSYVISAAPVSSYVVLSFDGANFKVVVRTNSVVDEAGITGNGNVVLQNNPTINFPTITTPNISNGSIASSAITSPLITSPTITGGNITDIQIFPTTVSKAFSYTVAPTDCSSNISFNSAGSGGQGLVFSGSYATGCTIIALNEDSRAWSISGTGPGTFLEWPGQVCLFTKISSAWRTNCPYRYNVNSGVVNVGQSPCNNSNDGLSATANGRLCSIQSAINLIHSSWDNLATTPTVQLTGNFTECFSNIGYITGGGDQIMVTGNPSSPSSVVLTGCGTAGVPIADAEDGGILTLNGVELACNNGPGSKARQNGTLDEINIIFGSCTGQSMNFVSEGGHINLTGNVTVAGNAFAFATIQGAGSTFLSGTVTITGSSSLVMTYFVDADGLAQADFAAVGLVFSGFGSFTAQRFSGGNLAEIRTNGNCTTASPGTSTFFPGSVGGSLTNGAVCD